MLPKIKRGSFSHILPLGRSIAPTANGQSTLGAFARRSPAFVAGGSTLAVNLDVHPSSFARSLLPPAAGARE